MAVKQASACLQTINKMQRFSMSTVSKIGNREIVGFGLNGSPSYLDRLERPMPAIRFKENTPEIQVILKFLLKNRLYYANGFEFFIK